MEQNKPDNKPKIFAGIAVGLLIVAVALITIFISTDKKNIPDDAVARAGNISISDEAFDHWLEIAAMSQQQAQPDDKKKKKKDPVPKKGTQEYNQLRDQVMQFLINAAWIEQEAADKDVAINKKDIDKEFEKTKKQFFPKKKDFDKFLKTSGMSLDDVRLRVKLQLLSNKIRENVTKEASKVSSEDIDKYYKKNKKQFTTPATVDVKLILTKKKSDAEKAKKALEDGDSFKSVAKKYSTDEASKNNGGKLNGVTEGQFGKKFDEEVFKKGKKGVIIGPFKTSLGYYVVEITKKTKKKTTSLKNKATRKQIKGILESQGQQEALQKFIEDFREEWKSRTECNKGFVVQECGNAPKPKTTAPPAGGGAPPQQGGGSAPPPQQGGGSAPPPQQGGGSAPPPQQGGGSAPPPSGGQ